MCIRNDAGEFVWAKTDWFAPLCDVDVGEAVGLHTALQWVSGLQFDNVDYALDSKRVVDHVNTDEDDNSEFGCVEMCLKIDVEVWKNRGTILGVFLGGCHWKSRGTMQRQHDTMQKIRSCIVLLPTPTWHNGLAA